MKHNVSKFGGLVVALALAGCGGAVEVGVGNEESSVSKQALSGFAPAEGVYVATWTSSHAAIADCSVYFPAIRVSNASSSGYDWAYEPRPPGFGDFGGHCTLNGHKALCMGAHHTTNVYDLRPFGLDMVATLITNESGPTWPSATQYAETSTSIISCEGTACGDFERCVVNGRGVRALQ